MLYILNMYKFCLSFIPQKKIQQVFWWKKTTTTKNKTNKHLYYLAVPSPGWLHPVPVGGDHWLLSVWVSIWGLSFQMCKMWTQIVGRKKCNCEYVYVCMDVRACVWVCVCGLTLCLTHEVNLQSALREVRERNTDLVKGIRSSWFRDTEEAEPQAGEGLWPR